MARAVRTESARAGRPPRRRWILLGHIETAAPSAALLRALRELRPQCTLRVRSEPTSAGIVQRYRIELAADAGAAPRGAAVTPWLRVKSALLAAFPADKPNAVRALD